MKQGKNVKLNSINDPVISLQTFELILKGPSEQKTIKNFKPKCGFTPKK